MPDDIDFDQLIDLLDRALTSKDPKVMQALKKFLFIAALATEDTEEEGPFKNILKRIEALEAQVAAQRYAPPSYVGTATPNSPYWVVDTKPKYYYGSSTGTVWINNPSNTATYAVGEQYPSSVSTIIDSAMNDLSDLQEQAKDLQKK